MNIETFRRTHGLEWSVRTTQDSLGSTIYMASFLHCELRRGAIMLTPGTGRSRESVDAAKAEYAEAISGQLLIYKAAHPQERMELQVPPLSMDGLVVRLPRLLLSRVQMAWNHIGNHDKVYGAAEAIVFDWPASLEAPMHNTLPVQVAWNFYGKRSLVEAQLLEAVSSPRYGIVDNCTHPCDEPGAYHVPITSLHGPWRRCEAMAYDLLQCRNSANYWWGDPDVSDGEPWRMATTQLGIKRSARYYNDTPDILEEVHAQVDAWRVDMFTSLNATPDYQLFDPTPNEVLLYVQQAAGFAATGASYRGEVRDGRVAVATAPATVRRRRRGITFD